MSSTSALPAKRRIYLAVSQQVFASREAIWKVLKDKIYNPTKYVGCRDVKAEDGKAEDGTPYVDREMTVGPPSAPEVMLERITWDESTGVVTFRTRDDPAKDGVVYHYVEQKEGVDVITFVFDLRYKEHVPQQKVDDMRDMLNTRMCEIVKTTIGFMHKEGGQ